MTWIVGRRYVVFAVLLCVFALARVAFAAGSGTCRLTYNYAWVGPIKVEGSFSCVNVNCTGTCPAGPTADHFILPDEDGDGNPEDLWVYYCHCVGGPDRPANSGGDYCQGNGYRKILSGGGTSFDLFCATYGACAACVTADDWEWEEPFTWNVQEWCTCP